MQKYVEVNAVKEFAGTFLGDPILKMTVNAVLDHAPAADISPLTSAEKQAIFRLGQMDMREKVLKLLTDQKGVALGVVRTTLSDVIERVMGL